MNTQTPFYGFFRIRLARISFVIATVRAICLFRFYMIYTYHCYYVFVMIIANCTARRNAGFHSTWINYVWTRFRTRRTHVHSDGSRFGIFRRNILIKTCLLLLLWYYYGIVKEKQNFPWFFAQNMYHSPIFFNRHHSLTHVP